MPEPMTAIFCRCAAGEVKAMLLVRPSAGKARWVGSHYAPASRADQTDPRRAGARISTDAHVCVEQPGDVCRIARAAAEKGARGA